MPDNALWDELLVAAHDYGLEMPVGLYDRLDLTLHQFAEALGITPDRPTLEAALWTVGNIIGMAWMFEAGDRGAEAVLDQEGGEPTEENQVLAIKAMRYLIVKRLDRLADAK
jgi:hypothetical protein